MRKGTRKRRAYNHQLLIYVRPSIGLTRPREWIHILPGEKEIYLQKCLSMGYVSSQEGNKPPSILVFLAHLSKGLMKIASIFHRRFPISPPKLRSPPPLKRMLEHGSIRFFWCLANLSSLRKESSVSTWKNEKKGTLIITKTIQTDVLVNLYHFRNFWGIRNKTTLKPLSHLD